MLIRCKEREEADARHVSKAQSEKRFSNMGECTTVRMGLRAEGLRMSRSDTKAAAGPSRRLLKKSGSASQGRGSSLHTNPESCGTAVAGLRAPSNEIISWYASG